MGGSDDGDCLASGEGVADEVEKSAIGLDGDDVERDEGLVIDGGSDDVFVVGVEDSQIIVRPIIGGGGDNLKSLRGKPVIDLGLGDGDEFEAGLGDADGEVVFLDQNSLQPIQLLSDEVLEAEALQVLDGCGLPKVIATGILIGGNERKINAGGETEDTASGYFEITIVLDKDVVFLATSNEASDKRGHI